MSNWLNVNEYPPPVDGTQFLVRNIKITNRISTAVAVNLALGVHILIDNSRVRIAEEWRPLHE